MKAMIVLVLAAAAAAGAAPGHSAFPGPASSTIAFSRFWAPDSGTYVTTLDGAARKVADGHLTWSPNGKKVAGALVSGHSCVTGVIDLRSGRRTTLRANCHINGSPAWSPDGTQLVYSVAASAEDLFVIGADGKGRHQLTHGPVPDLAPSWSPDGGGILFHRVDEIAHQGKTQLYIVSPDGSDVQQLTTATTAIDANRFGDWSPDGRQIAFASSRDESGALYAEEIYVMNADGSNVRRLTTNPGLDSAPSWSPDGRQIVFISARGGASGPKPDVYVMNADGSDQRKVASGGVEPHFLPRGAITKIP